MNREDKVAPEEGERGQEEKRERETKSASYRDTERKGQLTNDY